MKPQSRIIFLIYLISITSNEAARIHNEKEEVDFLKENYQHLFLQSLQWNPVPSPRPNPGTSNVPTQIIAQRNFAGRKEFAPPPPYPKIALGVATD